MAKKNSNFIDPITGLDTPREQASLEGLDLTPIPSMMGMEPVIHAGSIIGKRRKYDDNITFNDLNDLERERALHQPGASKALNAIVGGVASGLMTAVEDLAYIGDIDNHIKRIRDVEEVESNWLSDLMKQGKEGLDRVMPIHRMNQDVFDWNDPGFYWSSIKGILDSAVGFALPGMAAAKVIGSAQKLARGTKYLNMLRTSERGQQMVNAGLSGMITNYGEGKMMALELFENSMNNMEANLLQTNLEKRTKEYGTALSDREIFQMAQEDTQQELNSGAREEFEGIAGEQADAFIKRNRMFALTDAIGLHGIYKGKNAIRNMLKERNLKTFGNRFITPSSDNLILQGLKEGAEEIGQNILQMEGEYQAAKGAGLDTGETPEDFLTRAFQFGTSEKALLEGLMGVFGGGPQRILTEAVSGRYAPGSRKSYANRLKEQQAQVTVNKEYLNKKLGDLVQGQAIRAEALRRGDTTVDDYIKKSQFHAMVLDNFKLGTVESVENQLRDIRNLTPEQAAEQGYDENYKQQAEEHLTLIRDMERDWLKVSKYENPGQVFENRQQRRDVQSVKNIIEQNISDIQSEIEQQGDQPDASLQDELKISQNQLEQTNEELRNLDQKYKDMTSADEQQLIRKEKKKNQEIVKNAINNAKAKAKEDAAKETGNTRKTKAQKKQNRKDNKEGKKTVKNEVDEDYEGDIPGNEGGTIFGDITDDGTATTDIAYDPEFGEAIEADEGGEVTDIPGDQIDQMKAEQDAKKNLRNNISGLMNDLKGDVVPAPATAPAAAEEPVFVRRARAMGEIIADLQRVKKKDVTFDDVVDAFVELTNEDDVRSVFGMLEGLYKQINPNYSFTDDFDLYNSLTPEQRRELEGGKKVADLDLVTQYTSKTDKKVEKATQSIIDAVNKLDKNEDPTDTSTATDFVKVKEGSGILAYLSRKFEQIFKSGKLSRQEIEDTLNEDLEVKSLLDPEKFGPGTVITLRVQDDDNTPAYVKGDNTKTKTTWGGKQTGYKAELDKAVKDGLMTQEEADQKYQDFLIEDVPIAVYAGEERIGYLHETEWINDTNISGNVEQDKNRSRAIREHILNSGGEYTTTISDKSSGYLFVSKDGHITLEDAMPDPNLEIVIGSKGEYKLSRKAGDSFKGKLVNKGAPYEGVPHVIVPLGSRHGNIAIPLKTKKLSENKAVVDSVMAAIDIYFNKRYEDANDTDAKRVVDEIADVMGINIGTPVGFITYIETFLNNANLPEGESLRERMKDPSYNEYMNDTFVSVKKRGDDDAVIYVTKGRNIDGTNMSKGRRDKIDSATFNGHMAKIRSLLENAYGDIDLTLLNSGKDIVLVNADGTTEKVEYKSFVRSMTTTPILAQNIAEEGEPEKWVYTIQPVITLDFAEVDEYLAGTEGENTIFKTKQKTEKKEQPERKPDVDDEVTDDIPNYEDLDGGMDIDPDWAGTPAVVGMDVDAVKDIKDKTEVRVKDKSVTGVIISKMQVERQKDAVDYLVGQLVDKLFKADKITPKLTREITDAVKEVFENNVEKAKRNKELAIEANHQAGITKWTATETEFQLILDSWEAILALTDAKMRNIDGVIRTEVDPESDEALPEQKDQMAENANWSDTSVFTINPSDRLSPQIKRFLSGIGQWEFNEEGKRVPSKNYFGLQKPLSYQQAYEILQRLTANQSPNFDKLMAVLEAVTQDPNQVKTYPFMPELVKKLKNTKNQQIKNQFVTGMTNHDVDMRFIMFTTDQKTGKTKLIERSSNANSVAAVIRSKWHSAFISDVAAPNIENMAEYQIPEGTRKNLLSRYETMLKNSKQGKHDKAQLREWLNDLGVVVTDETMDDIMSGRVKHEGENKTIAAQIQTNGGLFYVLAQYIDQIGSESVLSGKRLIDEGVLKSLSKHDARYDKNSFSNSHRSGNKTIYSFAQNKYLINRVRTLLDFDEEGANQVLDLLTQLSFNGTSTWGRELTGGGLMIRLKTLEKRKKDESDQKKKKEIENEIKEVNESLKKLDVSDDAFLQNFDRWVMSLEPLKEIGRKSKDNQELHKLSEDAIEVAKIGMLQASNRDLSGSQQRIIRLFYPTTSDKTTVMGLRVVAQPLKMSREGEISEESIQRIMDYVVQPELLRIKSYQDKAKKEQKDIADIKGYDKGAQQFLFLPVVNQIEGVFLENGQLSEDAFGEVVQNRIKAEVRNYINSEVETKLAFWEENGIGTGDGFAYLNSDFMWGDVAKENNPMGIVDKKNKLKGAATDMVFQYLIGNAEMAKLFTGDPAMYYKASKKNNGKSRFNEQGANPDYDFVADAKETYDNIGKRLAADIAPGYEIAEGEKTTYRQGFIDDSKSFSLYAKQITKVLDGEAAYKKIKDLEGDALKKATKDMISAPYHDFDGNGFASTDAQEYTTWEEHLYVMLQAGDITQGEHDQAAKTLRSGGRLTSELMGKVLQPMKPVYVDNKIDVSEDIDRRIYIKSSAFPLIPELTKDLGLDNLRVAMEDQGIDRVSFSTAVKVGNFNRPANVFDSNGDFLTPDKMKLAEKSLELDRSGFRLQQKIPYDPAVAEINKVTQASKNLFVNMLNVEGFSVGFDGSLGIVKAGEAVSGSDLQDEYYETYRQLHELEYNSILAELTDDNDVNKLNRKKLYNLLKREARERNYPISDQEMLRLDEELRSLPFLPSANKYEALLNSIVTNRVIKLKMPGKSYVLGSEEGFKERIVSPEEATKKIAKGIQEGGIITTDAYDPKTGLKPAREENGERKPAQAIVPWKFKDKEGNTIDIRKYLVKRDGKFMLDRSKLPVRAGRDPLHIFGMRIPNQGPNSQSWIEIVGFLPKASGDLLVATRDYVVQMGSDFDVDKLYTYMYNVYEPADEDKILVSTSTSTTDLKRKELQNRILDIHIAVHRNPDQRVQEQIANPLGFWELKNISDDVVGLREQRADRERTEEEGRDYFTGLSDHYQRTKFKNAAAGKSGVGVFSLDSMFNAISQGRGLRYVKEYKTDDDGNLVPVYLEIEFGGKISTDGDLSREFALDGKTFISDIISGYQSGAVDNEKEQILDKVNINSHTFGVIKILNQLGFGEEVPYFLSQDIIVDYVRELDRLSSPLVGYTPNREEVAKDAMYEKYNVESIKLPDEEVKRLADDKATVDAMKEYIAKGPAVENYVAAQKAFLDKFIELVGYGQTIHNLQTTINPDSKGIGKSLIESQLKEEQVYGLVTSKVENAENLVGDIVKISEEEIPTYKERGYFIREEVGENNLTYAVKSNTINGHAIVYGLFTNNDLWSNLFNYRSPFIDKMFRKYEGLTDATNDMSTAAKAERRLEIWKDFKSYVFSGKHLNLHDTTAVEERERLAYDRWDGKEHVQKSLGTIVREIQGTPFGRANPLISRFEVEVHKNGDPTTISYRASRAEDMDQTDIYMAFVDLFTSEDATGASPVIHEVNGKPYTMRQLGQELVLFSYLTGGIQEAVQFVKFVPAAYLSTIGFLNQLSNMDNIESKFGVQPMEDEREEYYNIPPFVEQRVQHEPYKVQQISAEHFTTVATKNKKTTKFKVKENFTETYSFAGFLRPYLSFKDATAATGFRLFKYDFANDIYVQIDTLGTFGVTEYNMDTIGDAQSSITRNKSAVQEIERPTGPNTTERPGSSTEKSTTEKTPHKDPILGQVTRGEKKTLTYEDGVQKVRSVLNTIVNYSDDSYNAVLADELLGRLDQIPSNMKFRIGRNSPTGEAGMYDARNHIMSIYTDGHQSETQTEQTFLHEMLHALTVYKVRLFVYDESTAFGKTLRRSVKNIPNFKMTEKDNATLRSLQVTLNKAREALLVTEEDKAAFRNVVEKYERLVSGQATEYFTNEELDNYYGLINLDEFITMAFTRPNFRNILNTTDLSETKTFWQSVREKIMRLLEGLGFDMNPDGILYQVVGDTLDLTGQMAQTVDQSKPETTGKKIMNMTFDNQFQNVKDGLKTQTTRENKNNYVTGDRIVIQDNKGNKLNATVTYVEPVNITDVHNLPENDEYFTLEGRKGQKNGFVKNTQYLKKKDGVVKIGFKVDGISEKPTVERTEKVIKGDDGNFYKFILEGDSLIEGFYSQGNPNNWKPLNIKTMFKKYAELTSKKKEDMSDRVAEDNQLKTPDGKIITFSDEQYEGVKKMRDWIDRGDRVFTLSGYAGTGKTTIVKKIVDEFDGKVVVCAPTHKASYVIADTTNLKANTLHSVLGLGAATDMDNFDPANAVFDPRNPPKMKNADLVIIDEASMVNQKLYKFTLEQAALYNTRVIFMGDDAQIPPVGEKRSNVFVEGEKDPDNFHLLKETQRLTDGNPLARVYDSIRNNLDHKDGGYDLVTDVNERGEGIIFTNSASDFADAIIAKFSQDDVKDDPNLVKVIAWRNVEVAKWNNVIREAKFGKNPNLFEKGEFLMGYNTYNRGTVMNSLDYKVTNVSDIVPNSDGINGYKLTLEYYDHELKRNRPHEMFIVDPTDTDNVNEFKRQLDLYAKAAETAKNRTERTQAWAKYYAFRERNLINFQYTRTNAWGKPTQVKKDIDYGYAITAHKSQGSTYRDVFVVESDMNKNRWSEKRHVTDRKKRKLEPLTEVDVTRERNKIKYVAMSRPTHTATVLTNGRVIGGNTHVDGPVKPKTDPDERIDDNFEGDIGSTDNPIKVGPRTDDDFLGDIPYDGGTVVDFNDVLVSDPQDFVTDEDLEEFMKKCEKK